MGMRCVLFDAVSLILLPFCTVRSESVWDFISSSPRPSRTGRARTVETVIERPVTNIIEKVVTVERVVEKAITNTVEKIVEKPVTNLVEKIVVKPVTNTVETIVYDHAMELKLSKEKLELEQRGAALEVRNEGLEKRNDELRRELEEERSKRERLERMLPREAKAVKTGRPARITSNTTNYDRKKGVVFFDGNVHVDDESYQLHADKAYVFSEGTNDIRRIVAIGNIAMTNETRRAYGDKISYYRKDGMVILYAGAEHVAEVRDESKSEDQTIRGSKIKFWVDNSQIEVLDATISAPGDGFSFTPQKRKR